MVSGYLSMSEVDNQPCQKSFWKASYFVPTLLLITPIYMLSSSLALIISSASYSLGVLGVLVGGSGSAGGHFFNKNYARFMSTSAKISIPVMAGLMLFSYRYEVAMHDAIR